MRFEPGLLSPALRRKLRDAGRVVAGCQQALDDAGINIVGEILRGQGTFIEMEHYPRDDVFDATSHGQYYYHAHRGAAEHGHFHVFLRGGGMSAGSRPLDYPIASATWPAGDEAICHLIAIAMDAWGKPIGLFCTNRWVTNETWYPAEQVIAMLDRFAVNHAFPNWAVNLWLSAMLRLFRPQIEFLIRQRDEVIEARQRQSPQSDVFEDRALDLTGYLPIDVAEWVEGL